VTRCTPGEEESARSFVASLEFGEDGLVPVVVQDEDAGEVLMLAYANADAVRLTLTSGRAHYYSRSRRRMWVKGESSGNFQDVVEVRADCDGDALLYRVRPEGPACHTGAFSCFDAGPALEVTRPHPRDEGDAPRGPQPVEAAERWPDVLEGLWNVIVDRKRRPAAGSYVGSLLESAPERAVRKVVEEAVEVALAGTKEDREEMVGEVADLWFHSLVALARFDLGPDEVAEELRSRAGKRRRGGDADGRR